MPFPMKKMLKNIVFEHFFPCKLPKEPNNQRILRLFAAKFYKSDRLIGLRQIGGIAQLAEQTAHIRSVIGSSPIAAIFSKSLSTNNFCSPVFNNAGGVRKV